MTRSLLSLLMVFVFAICNSQSADKIAIGNVDKIYSNVLKEERKLWVYNPASNRSGKSERYPVLYLLDAEEHFHSTVGMIRQMEGRWPAMIVVGITNTNRKRDLTPTMPVGEANCNCGGGENFMKFMEKELIPHIDSLYPVSPYRVLSGHSLGGLAVMHALINYPNLFNAYITIDPSLWWDNQKLLQQAKRDLSTQKFTNKSLFIGRAKNMPPGMDTLSALRDTTQYTMLFRSVTQLTNSLRENSANGLRWNARFYPEESHGTVQLNAQYDALKFLFSFYQFRTIQFERNPEVNIDSLLTAHFNKASAILGYTVLPSSNLINNLGYSCMELKKFEKAEFFFKLNIQNYPHDANGYDSMGDFYQAVGNDKKAIENYTKALTLWNDADTKRKLEFLKSKK